MLLSAGLLAIAMGIGRFAYTPLLPRMITEAGLSPAVGATVASANYVGYLLGAVAAVVWHDRIISRPWALAMVSMLAASLAASSVSIAPAVLVPTRAAAGFASAVLFVTAVDAARRAASDRPALLGWSYSGVGAGIALSTLVVLAPSWQSGWWWCAAASLLGLPIAYALHLTHAHAEPAAAGASRNRSGLRWLLAGYLMEGAAYIIGATFVVAALTSVAPSVAGSAWVLLGLAAIPSTVMWAMVSHRLGARRTLMVCLLLQAGGLIMLGQAVTATAVCGAVLLGATFMGVTTVALGLAHELGGRRGPAKATVWYGTGQIAGPLLVAPTLANGYGQGMIIAAVITCLAAGAIMRVPAPSHSPPAHVDGAHTAEPERS